MAGELIAFNEHDVARIAAVVRAHEGGGGDRGEWPRPADKNFARIRFRNDSGETIPGYAVMRVTGMATANGRTFFKVEKPNTTFHRLYLVNSRTPVTSDQKHGWGTWLWHGDYVLYDTTNTPAYGESWGPTNNSWKLKKDYFGFLIMGGNVTTPSGSERTVAVQCQETEFLAKRSSTTSKGSSAAFDIYHKSSETDSGIDITAKALGHEIPANKWAIVAQLAGGQWYASKYES